MLFGLCSSPVPSRLYGQDAVEWPVTNVGAPGLFSGLDCDIIIASDFNLEVAVCIGL